MRQDHTELRAALDLRAQQLWRRLSSHDRELTRLRDQRGAEVADDEHDPEGTTLSGQWSLLEGVRRTEERELAEVEAALARMDAGGYGVCAGCGAPIPVMRLRVRPMAAQCVPCAAARRSS